MKFYVCLWKVILCSILRFFCYVVQLFFCFWYYTKYEFWFWKCKRFLLVQYNCYCRLVFYISNGYIILFYFISYDGMIAIFLHIELIKIWFIIITLSFIFFILEKIFNLKIKNSLVKKQGYKNFQLIGFFYFFLFLVVTICLFIF